MPGAWEFWVVAWSFVATIIVVLCLGWALLRWWEWVTDNKLIKRRKDNEK
jgi:hypothetical protein